MITKLPNEFLTVISENNGLHQYLSNLSKGRPFTERSWLYENIKTPEDVLESWLSKLDTLQNGSSFEQNVYQFDTAQLEKWGPQGGIAPMSDLLEEVVLPTFQLADSPRPKAFATDSWDRAKYKVINSLMKSNVLMLRPTSYANVVDDMRARDTLASNSGWPLFSRRKKPDITKAAILAAQNGEWIDYPAIALFRNYNLKTRLVWMYPMSTNVVEGSYMQPLQSSIIKANIPFFTPWIGFEAVRDLINALYNSGVELIATDFSNTDSHFNAHAIMECYDVISRLFQRGSAGGLRQSLQRMYSIPLVISTSEMITGKHGVSSGSNWTNFVETIFDRVFAEYVRIESKDSIHGLCAIGDDMCWVANKAEDSTARYLAERASAVGQVVNADKASSVPNRVKFLQRLFQRGYSRPDGVIRAVYSTVRALKASIYPEKWHKPALWSGDMFCARQFMILENCVDHPLFEEFVKFICEGNEKLIPFAKKSAGELSKITRETKLLPGFNPTYNQEKRDTSLAAFKSIEVARML